MERIQADAVSIGVLRLTLPNGLRVDEVHLEAASLSAVRDPLSVELGAPAPLTAKVGERSVADFLEAKSPGNIRHFEVAIQEGKIFIKATVRMLFEVRGLIVCRLEVVEGRQIFVRFVEAQFLGVNPKQLVQAQLDQVNPILDAKDFPVSVELVSLALEDGFVTLAGTLAPPSRAAG